MNKNLQGIIAMLVTPFSASEEIDEGALSAEVDWCAQQGANGIVATPSIGEFACLSNKERWRCFEVCYQAASRYPGLFTVAMISATHTRDVLEQARVAKSIGYDAAQLIPPYYWVPDEEEVYRHYQLAAQVGLPIVVYHNPALSKFYMRREFLSKLSEIPGIIAIKEVKTDRHVDLEPLFSAIKGKVKIFTTFRVLTTGLILGSAGGFINVFAVPACVKILKLFQEGPDQHGGQREQAERLQQKVNEFFSRGGEDNKRHIGTTKMAASVVTGIPMGPPRAPYLSPDPKFEKQMRARLPELTALL